MFTVITTIIVISILLWYLVPHLMLYLYPIPKKHTHILSLTVKSLVVVIPSILAPIIVPIALIFTKWKDNKLPRIFSLWDNDVSINGDRKEDWGIDNYNHAYYAKSPPRSFWARYVWLGWRNRCSRLVETLGYKYLPNEFENRNIIGNPFTSRSQEGWKYTHTDNISQLVVIKAISKNLCIRYNWGYKFFDKPRTPFATITFSILSYRGEK